ncbi:hypothetical protein FQV43_03585 [Corynebacterium sp. sy039]|nr:hypothetical protein FQV43_03585 [Corynebacterium sp. sy039]
MKKVLLDAQTLPQWNPAFSRVGTTQQPGVYSLTVHHFLSGKLCYIEIDNPITLEISIPGLIEHSNFFLSATSAGTLVKHSVQQKGRLASIIGQREASLVPAKRLNRLELFLTQAA